MKNLIEKINHYQKKNWKIFYLEAQLDEAYPIADANNQSDTIPAK